MAEFLDVYDANGKFIGSADRNVVHAFALWHKTVHCWIVWDGKMVFQRRSARLDTNPNKLYTTASGHISAGETIEQAFAREIEQEIGIVPQNPKFLEEFFFIKDIKKKDCSIFADRVFTNIFWAQHNGILEDFKFSDDEVDSVVAIDLNDFIKWSRKPEMEIKGIEWNGKNISKAKISSGDFVVNACETIYSKYGRVAEMICDS